MAKAKKAEREPKRPRGRPRSSRIHEMPDQIPDSPENVAMAILTTPPKREEDWEYQKRGD